MYIGRLLAIVVGLVSLATASSGDRLPEFNECRKECVELNCPRTLPLHLRLLLWSCESDCDYRCQQIMTNIHESTKAPVHQYYGKWPFVRLWGIQEPASVLFSLMNMAPNVVGLKSLLRERTPPDYGMKPYYLGFAVVGINTWLWSAVFHTRDFVVTERLDYFSAIFSILYGLVLAMVRIFRLDRPTMRSYRLVVFAAALIFYTGHVYYLTCVRFSYAYNMAAGVGLGVLQTSLWLFGGIRAFLKSRSAADLGPPALVVSVIAASSLELFDFSPFLRTVDAHSLWHLATVFPHWYWYRWMRHDIRSHWVTKRD